MPGKNRQAIKQPLPDAIWLRRLKTHVLWLRLSKSRRFPPTTQQIPLRSVDLLVQIDSESEEHIVRIQWLAIRKLQPLPQGESVCEAVGRNSPRFGQRGFRDLRRAVDMDQVSLHDADDLTGSRICCNQRVQRFGFAAKRYDKPSTRMADFSRSEEH